VTTRFSPRSLYQLAKANILLLAHTLPSRLVIAPFAAVTIVHLNEFFTRTPLETGGPTVLTIRLRQPSSSVFPRSAVVDRNRFVTRTRGR
jgi:hypothetical protein